MSINWSKATFLFTYALPLEGQHFGNFLYLIAEL